jgi:putative CocE/NonD family hydrolase
MYQRLPLRDVPEVCGVSDYYFNWLEHPEPDVYWDRLRVSARSTARPAIHIAGWYDIFLSGGLADYERSARLAPQALVIGPWSHGVTAGQLPEMDFGIRGSQASVDVVGLQLAWFDRWVKGDSTESSLPGATVFIQGSNIWSQETSWPPSDVRPVPLYLDSAGRANTLFGDGLLAERIPISDSSDDFVYDPLDPVPTHGGATYFPDILLASNAGPRDQRQSETRPDVLCYTTEPLVDPLTLMGHVEAVLFVSSSAEDTDFTVKLIDVWPDGRAMALTDGILRARYRESLSDPTPLKPNTVYEIRVDAGSTAATFATGHRLRLEISSSNFPRFDRNTNTGGRIAVEGAGDVVRAQNRIHHSSRFPSRLVLPVVEARDAQR